MNAPEIVLWFVQGFLAVFFLAAGIPKIFARGLDRWTGFSDLPSPLVVFIGVVEVIGGAALVVPMALGSVPWLTPLAAVGLAVTVLMASGFHLRADERLATLETTLWAGLCAVVAVGRWNLIIPGARVPGWMLVVAAMVILPAVIVNIVILWRASSPVDPTSPANSRHHRQHAVESGMET